MFFSIIEGVSDDSIKEEAFGSIIIEIRKDISYCWLHKAFFRFFKVTSLTPKDVKHLKVNQSNFN